MPLSSVVTATVYNIFANICTTSESEWRTIESSTSRGINRRPSVSTSMDDIHQQDRL